MFIKTKNFFTGYIPLISLVLVGFSPIYICAEAPYLEPGSLRLSHEITLEGLFHRVTPGWRVENSNLDKTYSRQDGASGPWQTEWGQSLLTEAAARFTSDIFSRILFEAQGDYADRFWRPNNINHYIDQVDRHLFLREAELRVDKANWYAKGFAGVAHGDWRAQGDFFGLYPSSYPDDDYLRHSGYFGVYPSRFQQNLFLNISKRRVPEGVEAGASLYGIDGAVAYGEELQWGYDESFYGRVGTPIKSSKLTFTYRDEDVPYLTDIDEDRKRTYALSLAYPEKEGHWLDVGVLYQPFRVGERYKVADETDSGSGLQGSSWRISEKTSKKSDALGGRVRVERHLYLGQRDYLWHVDVTRAGVLAGNKEEADVGLGTDIIPILRGRFRYVYRRPLEGPIPFLFEGTANNLGQVVANPRGPESPFTVDWTNREASFFTSTFVFDPTPGTSLFRYNPDVLQTWNINPEENAPFALAVQFKLSDYKTTTDRLTYVDSEGNIVFEPAARNGAWASDHPLPEVQMLIRGSAAANWMLGFAAGESPATLGLAYSNDTRVNKPLTDFYSVEGRLEKWPFETWVHYGYGLWGPEPYQHSFGESFDRLWGLGVSYHFNVNTSWDVSYLAARQDDNLFVAPGLGTYDEIRTLFSHRFGFLFEFQDAARAGYRVR